MDAPAYGWLKSTSSAGRGIALANFLESGSRGRACRINEALVQCFNADVGGREGFQRELGLQSERDVFSDEVTELAGIKVCKTEDVVSSASMALRTSDMASFVGLLSS